MDIEYIKGLVDLFGKITGIGIGLVAIFHYVKSLTPQMKYLKQQNEITIKALENVARALEVVVELLKDSKVDLKDHDETLDDLHLLSVKDHQMLKGVDSKIDVLLREGRKHD